MARLSWPSDEAWAPHRPASAARAARQAAGRRPPRRQRHPARAQDRLPPARRAGRVRPGPDEIAIDGTRMRVRRSAAGAKGGSGRTSEVHCLADGRGQPVAFAPTPGNVADVSSVAVPLLGAVATAGRLIADKAYDADGLRRWLKARRTQAVTPSTAARTVAYLLDRQPYRRRNLIERLFGRLKN